MTTTHRRQRGVSLIELAVGLVIAALLATLLLTVVPLGNEVADGERQQRELARADEALLGYLRSHGRLPAADQTGDGRGDAGVSEGWLPVTELGLPTRLRVRYQVQPTLATAPGDVFRPFLPPDYRGELGTAGNGLDMCMRLLLNQRDGLSVGGLDMPVAYYLGHPGAPGHGTGPADAVWNAAGQPVPGAATAPTLTLAAGPAELASRLACPERLARAQGGAQAAYAAYSALRVSDFNRDFRAFDVKIAQLIVDHATTTRNLAIYALADAIASEAVAVVLTAAGWPPDKLSLMVGAKYLAAGLAGATLSLALAIKGIVDAEKALNEANADLAKRRGHLTLVEAQRTRTEALYVAASRNALALDAAGLSQ